MKSLKIVLLSLLAAVGLNASAQTVPADVSFTGTFVAACSLNTPTMTLGVVDLEALTVQNGTKWVHTRIPVNLGVTCNEQNLVWKLYNTNPNISVGAPNVVIGSTAIGNRGCLSKPRTGADDQADSGAGTVPRCATLAGTGDSAYLTNTGTSNVAAEFVIWTDSYASNVGGTQYAGYKGTGGITTTVPMTLSF